MSVADGRISPLFTTVTRKQASHFAYPRGNAARFILPTQESLAQASLRFFLPYRQRAKMQIRHWLSQTSAKSWHLETNALRELTRHLEITTVHAAVALGTPGPYNKQTVLLMGPTGQPLAIAKFGTTADSHALLKNEATWLKWASKYPILKDQIPSLIALEPLTDGLVLIQSIGHGTAARHRFGPIHADFLSKVQEAGTTSIGYVGSPMQRLMINRYQRLIPCLTNRWIKRIENGLSILDNATCMSKIPMSVAHRDFSPWNTRVSNKRLFTFDWEYASQGYLPLYDIFHYQLMPIVLKKEVDVSDVDKLFCSTWKLKGLFPESDQKFQYLGTQLLAYLLDLCLFYLESNQGKDTGDIVTSRYAHLIERYDEWNTYAMA